MAQSASPSAKKPPTIQTSGEPARSLPASPAEPPLVSPGSLPWPARVPPVIVALEIVSGRCQVAPELEAATESFRRSLTFVESAALHAPEPSEQEDALRACVATRWRAMAALALRPGGELAPDAAAFEELLQEVDGTLASLGKLKEGGDPDLQEACDAARAALAKDVQKLLPSTNGPAPVSDSQANLKQLRNALADAAKSEHHSAKGLRVIGQTKKTIIAAALALATIASGGFSLTKLLAFDQPRPVPALPQPPPNTEVLGNPESGTVIVRSTNGKPLDDEALQKFKARAADVGAHVQVLGPTQLLVTSAQLP